MVQNVTMYCDRKKIVSSISTSLYGKLLNPQIYFLSQKYLTNYMVRINSVLTYGMKQTVRSFIT